VTRARWIPIAEGAGLAAFGALAVAHAADLLDGARGLRAVALALPALALGLLAADFMSGVGHWACDRYFSADAPIVGPLVVRTFREHHVEPEAMVDHGFVELNGDSALALVPVMALSRLLPPAAEGDGAFFVRAFLLAFAFGILLTNSVHRWAHARRRPRAVAWLQERGLLLHPTAHALHHSGRHLDAYCITTGWWNRALDRVGFFRALERGLRAVGAPPAEE
jgi:ubiquitin-conjugating enzyme E2 variant